jgi:hypothetical protein
MEMVPARRRRLSTALPWALCGLSVGLAAGFLLGEMLGSGAPGRLGRRVARRTLGERTQLARADSIARVEHALAAEPALRNDPIQVRSRGPRGLELRGWVSTRAARTLAHRIARRAAGPLDVANRVLVRGEDDRSDRPAREDVPRPA